MFRKIFILGLFSLLLVGCTKPKAKTTPVEQKKQLVNALPVKDRPFVALFPHPSNKLLTIQLDKLTGDYQQATLDLEYLSGTSLKGGRTTLDLPVAMPHNQAFLLGSCSSGGKCSFDTDLVSGTLKTKLDNNSSSTHVLKSEFVFVKAGSASTPDTRVSWQNTSTKVVDQILLDTTGLPLQFDGELAYAPIAISSSSNKKISGSLNFKVSGVKTVKLFNGSSYQDLAATIGQDEVKINLNLDPIEKTVEIIRDDLKGAKEPATLYLLGPILLVK